MSGGDQLLRRMRRVFQSGSIMELPNRYVYHIHFGLWGSLLIFSNYKYFQREREFVVDFESFGEREHQMLDFKRQELADVRKYNSRVEDMRKDLLAKKVGNDAEP